MAAPSPYELEILPEFRRRVTYLSLNEFLNSDMELLRWIRARDNNLDQAELMLRKHMKWREEVDYDHILLLDIPKQCEVLMPEKLAGFDDDNCPLIITPLGKWNAKKVIQDLGTETALLSRWRYLKIVQETMKDKLTSEGVPVTQYSVISDLEGLSIGQGTLSVLRILSDAAMIFEANFPESSKCMVVVNAPWFFPVFYKWIKPFLNNMGVPMILKFRSLGEQDNKIHEIGKENTEVNCICMSSSNTIIHFAKIKMFATTNI
ncbi:unnamed protein product [Allacma fusca]|uniref:CRAL-TRIO domain-containing protein n=1 Tax=Allacma fusca TaxID=39272 RepID=A0A8J2P0D0_9HEXA|nr:unnamed protein product [Allacma fusca]